MYNFFITFNSFSSHKFMSLIPKRSSFYSQYLTLTQPFHCVFFSDPYILVQLKRLDLDMKLHPLRLMCSCLTSMVRQIASIWEMTAWTLSLLATKIAMPSLSSVCKHSEHHWHQLIRKLKVNMEKNYKNKPNVFEIVSFDNIISVNNEISCQENVCYFLPVNKQINVIQPKSKKSYSRHIQISRH